MTLEAGTTIGRYQILGTLGHGGMASVYKAFQPALERVVALKVLRPAYAHDPEFMERFRREALAIARLRHPHIVQVHDFDEAAGLVFLVMEHIEGGTLKQKLTQLQSEGSGLPWGETARVVREVAEALAHAHAQGIVHRDVKPSNVMLTRDGRAVVTDFGIAKILAAAGQTQTGVGVGTPEYMSPEQGQAAPVDHRSDVYSLGVMAYELLTGRVPYMADTPLAIMLAHVREPLPLPSKVEPRIGPRIEQVLLRGLAKDPTARYQSATEFAEALEAAISLDDQGGTVATVQRTAASAPAYRARPRGSVGPFERLPGPLMALIGAAAVLIAAAGGAAVMALVGGGSASPAGLPLTPPAAVSAAVATGSNVKATLAAIAGPQPASITFGLVSAPGDVTVRTVASGPILPLGVTLATGAYFDITTTAKFDRATVCFENENVTPRAKLLHYIENAWQDRTTSVDPPRICGDFTSFSPVAIVEVSVGVAARTPGAPPTGAAAIGPAASVTTAVIPAGSPATAATTVTASAVPGIGTPAPTIAPVAAATSQATSAPTIPLPLAVTPASTIPPTPVPTAAAGQLLVTGRVTAATSGAGIAAVIVRVFTSSTTCCPMVAYATTAPGGSYSVSVPPGRYRILFEAQPASRYAPAYWGGGLGFESAAEMVLSGGDRSGIDVALADGQLVTGRVVDAASGTALDSVQVVVNDAAAGGGLVTSPLVGSDGSFAIRLADGRYRFSYRLDSGRENIDRSPHTVVVAGAAVDVGVIRISR